MPPWQSVQAQVFKCENCKGPFTAKRKARFCSARCQNRSRVRTPPTSEQRKQWRAKRLKRPGYRERENAVANIRIAGIKRWLDDYKIEHGCKDCGYNKHPHALHFDHVTNNKVINVCNAKSLEQAQREVLKCEVRCANCHAIKTHERRQDRKSP